MSDQNDECGNAPNCVQVNRTLRYYCWFIRHILVLSLLDVSEPLSLNPLCCGTRAIAASQVPYRPIGKFSTIFMPAGLT